MDGNLAEPLQTFFKDWVSQRNTVNGRTQLPNNFLKDSKLERGQCYYKGCSKSAHRWDHCPKLAMHVAKNPAWRSHS